MTGNKGDSESKGPSELFFVSSERLRELRSLAEQMKDLGQTVGVAAKFSVVVDSNIILGDILWLLIERRTPNAKTALMEIIEAQTVVAYAPPRLVEEVEEKIPLIADEKGLDEEAMYAEWRIYKEKLKIAEPDSELVDLHKQGVDPNDAEFVALSEMVRASGVLSKDKHIGMMGGNTISVECVTHLRNYSRAAAIELNIKVNGVVVGMFGMAAVRALFVGIRTLIGRIACAPDWVKLALIVGVALVLLNPRARDTVVRVLESALSGIQNASPEVLSFIVQAVLVAESHQTEARKSLEEALKELGEPVEEFG